MATMQVPNCLMLCGQVVSEGQDQITYEGRGLIAVDRCCKAEARG